MHLVHVHYTSKVTKIILKEMQGSIQLMKERVKTFIMLQRILFQINAVLLNLPFIKEPWKKCYVFELFSTLIKIINVS